MKLIFSLLTAAMLLACSSCDIIKKDKDDPVLKLSSVGFEGTLPDNISSITTGIESFTDITGSYSRDFGSFLAPFMTFHDTLSKVWMHVLFPQVKMSKSDSIIASNIERQEYLKLYYPIEVVKNILAVGDKNITYKFLGDNFELQIYNQQKQNAYSTNKILSSSSQTGSTFKVVDLQEGNEIDPKLGNVNTLLVTFEIDVRLYKNSAQTYVGNMKGLLKMKYIVKS